MANVMVVVTETREVAHTCTSVESAESFIAGIVFAAKLSGDTDLVAFVEAGGYEIDAPEELVNPTKR